MAYDALANIERSGFAARGFGRAYDAYRPAPPTALIDVVVRWLGRRPGLVADLGSGTGASARAWATDADRVLGLEPNREMLAVARRSAPANVTFAEATAQATGLDSDSVDVVTYSQSVHWMEPASTFPEAARILVPGGVLAAYDYDWPPVVGWRTEQAYAAVLDAVSRQRDDAGTAMSQWDKDGHLGRIVASGRFRFAREVVLHHSEAMTADRLVGLVASRGDVARLRAHGADDHDLGLDALASAAARDLGTGATCEIGYRVRLAVTPVTIGPGTLDRIWEEQR